MPSPTRYPSGVTNSEAVSAFGQLGMPDPTRYHTWFDDFDNYLAAEWVRTAVGTGTTVVNTGSDGGILLTTNSAADNDAISFQMSENAAAGAAETFRFEAGKKLFFKSRFQVSDVIQSDFIMGLQITDTTPLDASDGVFFRKDDGDSDLDCVVAKAAATTVNTISGALANATFVVLAYYYNGKDAIEFYINDIKRATAAVTNLPNTEDLTISFHIQNGEAVAKSMSVDYIFVSKER